MAAKKFVRMLRTQTGDHGTHHAGVIYQVEPKVEGTFDLYIKRKFAEVVSAKELKKIVEDAAQVNETPQPQKAEPPAPPAKEDPQKIDPAATPAKDETK